LRVVAALRQATVVVVAAQDNICCQALYCNQVFHTQSLSAAEVQEARNQQPPFRMEPRDLIRSLQR
jgi:hypothetical protein